MQELYEVIKIYLNLFKRSCICFIFLLAWVYKACFVRRWEPELWGGDLKIILDYVLFSSSSSFCLFSFFLAISIF